MAESFGKSVYERVCGPEGLKLYQQWQASRPAGAPPLVCQMTTLAALSWEEASLPGGADMEARRRIATMAVLDRLYPEASLHLGSAGTLEFMESRRPRAPESRRPRTEHTTTSGVCCGREAEPAAGSVGI